MDQRTKKIIHLVSDAVLSLMLFVCGIAFALSCYGIYTSAETRMFTYESIGRAFGKIEIIVYITLALVAVGALLSLFLPREEEKPRPRKSAKAVCRRLAARVDLNTVDAEITAKIVVERKWRKGLFIAFAALSALEAVLPLFWLFDPQTFPAEEGQYNAEVLQGMLLYLCMLLPLLLFGIFCFLQWERSYAREETALKDALKAGAGASSVPLETEKPADQKSSFFAQNMRFLKPGARLAIFLLAGALIVLGILNGGMNDVLIKAVNICAECIGLG